ncbi:MAG: hypothetical protein AVDCRST_MAG19-4164, partial [uncultured Thermomicrobiales bacterium]
GHRPSGVDAALHPAEGHDRRGDPRGRAPARCAPPLRGGARAHPPRQPDHRAPSPRRPGPGRGPLSRAGQRHLRCRAQGRAACCLHQLLREHGRARAHALLPRALRRLGRPPPRRARRARPRRGGAGAAARAASPGQRGADVPPGRLLPGTGARGCPGPANAGGARRDLPLPAARRASRTSALEGRGDRRARDREQGGGAAARDRAGDAGPRRPSALLPRLGRSDRDGQAGVPRRHVPVPGRPVPGRPPERPTGRPRHL